MSLRRQLAVYSPLPLEGLWAAGRAAFGLGGETAGALERALAQEYAADAVLLFDSGTHALEAGLRLALSRVGGVKVALPAFTCFDVATAAVGADTQIELYDLDPVTLSPDLDSLAATLARGTRVVVIAPLYGFPVDWDRIAGLLDRHGAMAVEDAAQGFHATWRGRPVGSLGELSVLSFGRGKGWTGGAGGALLVRGSMTPVAGVPPHTTPPRSTDGLRVLGQLAAQWALGRPGLYALPSALPWLGLGETRYRAPTPPRGLTRVAAACLGAARAAADREAALRQANGRALHAALEDASTVTRVMPLEDAVPGFLRLPVRLTRGMAGFSAPVLARRLGILKAYPSLLAELAPVHARMNGTRGRWPGAAELVRALHTVPTHSQLNTVERRALANLLVGYRT